MKLVSFLTIDWRTKSCDFSIISQARLANKKASKNHIQGAKIQWENMENLQGLQVH